MNLYDIYDFCSFPLFTIPAYLLALFSALYFFNNGLKLKEFPPSRDSGLSLFFGESKIRTILVSAVCIFLVVFSSANFVRFLGCKDIRIMPEGTYCYYVQASIGNKTYTLPANIHISDEGEYVPSRTKHFHVNDVYFENGGHLHFENDRYAEKFNEPITDTDQNERYWKLKLTNKKATHTEVKETTDTIVWWRIMVMAFFAISILAACIIQVRHLNRKDTVNI